MALSALNVIHRELPVYRIDLPPDLVYSASAIWATVPAESDLLLLKAE
jgi:hypothetical protein